jgi:hypothetical protein
MMGTSSERVVRAAMSSIWGSWCCLIHDGVTVSSRVGDWSMMMMCDGDDDVMIEDVILNENGFDPVFANTPG